MTAPASELKTLGTTTSTAGSGVGAIPSAGGATARSRLAVRTELTTSRRARPLDGDLVFGRVFTDHIAIADWTEENGWADPRGVPYGSFSLDPAAAVFHYGQVIFDGLKAYRTVDGRVQLFRADRHCRRLADGAPRLCMPAGEPELTLDLLLGLVSADRDWVPSAPGTSLYIRPTLLATAPFLGVRPSKRYVFYIIASPVGAYHGSGISPPRIWVEDKYVRAAPGGLGAVKAGANYVASLLAAEEAKKRGYH